MTARKGLSYLETIVATGIIGLVVVAAGRALAVVARGQLAARDHQSAQILAEELLAEIETTSFADLNQSPVFGPESGEVTGTRAQFDDVDDYRGWTESPPQAKDGTVLKDYRDFSRSVTVQNVDPADLTRVVPDGSSDFKQVIVTVTKRGKRLMTLRCVRARHADDP
jgi:hypothetical protein